MTRYRTAYDITRTAMMLALALVLSILEAWLLPRGVFPVPGLKLGLANIAILVTLYSVGKKEALTVAVLRSLLLLAFGGNVVGFSFSLIGGIAAFCAMSILVEMPHVSIYGVSFGGAACHSLGQIVVAVFVSRTIYVVVYLPYLMILSCAAGGVIAFLTVPIVKALDHFGTKMIQ